jgi:hypothetical protein
MRPSRIITTLLFAAIGTPALLAAPAWAASPTPPVVVHASPNPVLAGHTVTLSGSVGPEAAGSDCSDIILYSDGFTPTNRVGDMTAVYATAKPSGAFSATTTIWRLCGGRTERPGSTPQALRSHMGRPTEPPLLRMDSSQARTGLLTVTCGLKPHARPGQPTGPPARWATMGSERR